jgi:hypothetical protein
MRKLALILLLTSAALVLGCPAYAITDPAVVQHTSGLASGAGTTAAATFTASNVTTGNYIVVTAVDYTTVASGTSKVATLTAKITATGGTKPTVTCTTTTSPMSCTDGGDTFADAGCGIATQTGFGVSVASRDILLVEVSGVDATTAVDSCANATPNPASASGWYTGATVTSSASNTALYAACAPGNDNTITATPPASTFLDKTVDGVANVLRTGIHAVGPHSASFQAGATVPDHDSCNGVHLKSADQTADTGVVLDNYVPVRADAGNSATTWSGSFTSGSGTNRLLLVRLFYNGSADTNSAPTYNGVSMTRVNRTCDDNGTQVCQDVYQLVAPATGSNTLSVTFISARFGYMIAKDFINVNQTTPVTSIQTENTQTTNPSNTTVTAAAGDWIDTGDVVNAKVACGSSSTIRDFAPATSGDPEMFEGHARGSGSVIMGWTHITGSSCPGTSGNAVHAQIAFDVQSATAAPRTFPHRTHIM